MPGCWTICAVGVLVCADRGAEVLIVGAGVGGLIAALALSARGLPVRVLESGQRPGGKAGLGLCNFLGRGVGMTPHRDVPSILAEDDPAPLPARLNFLRRHLELRALGHRVIQGPTKTLNISRSKGGPKSARGKRRLRGNR